MVEDMRVLDLFSGIGGFSLGLERAGMETVAFCEYDEKCRKVLKKHWPDVPQYNDVRTLTAEQLKNDGITIDLICGGYPCQPFSTAGKRAGEEDDRHLWPEVLRLIQEIRPAWVLCENVAGHISMGLDSVLADLEGEGYQQQVFIIPACAVGAYHRRDRVWILAHAESIGHRKGRRERDIYKEDGRSIRECGEFVTSAGEQPPNMAEVMADSNRINGSADQREPNAGADRRDESSGSGERSESGNWLSESGICRVANGVPNRSHRLKQLGNAVVPQVVEIIGRAIMESEA